MEQRSKSLPSSSFLSLVDIILSPSGQRWFAETPSLVEDTPPPSPNIHSQYSAQDYHQSKPTESLTGQLDDDRFLRVQRSHSYHTPAQPLSQDFKRRDYSSKVNRRLSPEQFPPGASSLPPPAPFQLEHGEQANPQGPSVADVEQQCPFTSLQQLPSFPVLSHRASTWSPDSTQNAVGPLGRHSSHIRRFPSDTPEHPSDVLTTMGAPEGTPSSLLDPYSTHRQKRSKCPNGAPTTQAQAHLALPQEQHFDSVQCYQAIAEQGLFNLPRVRPPVQPSSAPLSPPPLGGAGEINRLNLSQLPPLSPVMSSSIGNFKTRIVPPSRRHSRQIESLHFSPEVHTRNLSPPGYVCAPLGHTATHFSWPTSFLPATEAQGCHHVSFRPLVPQVVLSGAKVLGSFSDGALKRIALHQVAQEGAAHGPDQTSGHEFAEPFGQKEKHKPREPFGRREEHVPREPFGRKEAHDPGEPCGRSQGNKLLEPLGRLEEYKLSDSVRHLDERKFSESMHRGKSKRRQSDLRAYPYQQRLQELVCSSLKGMERFVESASQADERADRGLDLSLRL
eukprot:TRINITY_DN5882_c0_g6_i1.p1 TRINITY_DN5882_c0_g6~~TRINITY_DN5882_c0_g6_i1.p1  ORF type:complete len:560 (+),score=23.91 TRINITY_DN5882_c0_g6_i1:134-1813(+)